MRTAHVEDLAAVLQPLGLYRERAEGLVQLGMSVRGLSIKRRQAFVSPY
jgi:hypothetical protein